MLQIIRWGKQSKEFSRWRLTMKDNSLFPLPSDELVRKLFEKCAPGRKIHVANRGTNYLILQFQKGTRAYLRKIFVRDLQEWVNAQNAAD